MSAATITAGLSPPPDPNQDRGGSAMPQGIAAVLAVASILADYGRHLIDTVEHRALRRCFGTIAQYFGTTALPVIIAHLYRGVMRAIALEDMLRKRAKSGRDLKILTPRAHMPRKPPTAAGPAELLTATPATPAATQATPPRRRARPDVLLSVDDVPSMQQLEAEVRRRPVGRTIVDICRDLGIAPILCTGPFWNQVFLAIHCYRGSLSKMMLEMLRREKLFDREHWKHPKLELPEQTTAGVRQSLGFLIGEQAVDPLRPQPATGRLTPPEPGAPAALAAPYVPVAAAATGPPTRS